MLIADVLGCLVSPEAECSASTFHDDIRAKATEYTCLVVLTRVEVGNDGIVGVGELGFAGRAVGTLARVLAGDTKMMGTLEAEDVTTAVSTTGGSSIDKRIGTATDLQVVTRARSDSSLLH